MQVPKRRNQMVEVNKLKGEILVELAGKQFKGRLTVDSIIKIEDAVDMGIIKLAQKMADGDVRMSQVIAVLTPALRGGGNDLQPNDVVKLVEETGLVKSMKAVAELLAMSLTDNSDEKEVKEGKQEQGE